MQIDERSSTYAVARLSREHRALRAEAVRLTRLVGRQSGVGWDDVTDCDLAALRAAQERFSKMLLAHEAYEERCMARIYGGAPELTSWVEKNHGDLNALMKLLGAVGASCDGTHVHSLRSVCERLSEELEAHLDYEERILFPLL